MKAESPAPQLIKQVVQLLCLSNASTIAIFFAPEPLRSQWPPFAICAILALIPIFYLWKGKKWARVFILIGSVLNILAIPGFFGIYGDHTLYKIGAILEVTLTIYLLIVLNRTDVKKYFMPHNQHTKKKSSKIRIALIVLGIFVTLILLCGGFIWFISSKAQNQMTLSEIWSKDISSGRTDQLTTGGSNLLPRLSHDLKKVVFVHANNITTQDSTASIQSVEIESGKTEILIQDQCFNTYPSWGIEDKEIYYIAKCEGKYDIRVFDTTDGSTRDLTNDGVIKGNLCISPNSETLLFLQTNPDGNQDIYLMPAKGGDKTRLTKTANFIEEPKYPVWLRNSRGVIFQKFTSLEIIDLGGDLIESVDLANMQLTNVTDLFIDPVQADTFYIQGKGLKDSGLWSTGLYWVSLEQGVTKKVREATLLEVNHSVSSDGKWMVYSKPTDS